MAKRRRPDTHTRARRLTPPLIVGGATLLAIAALRVTFNPFSDSIPLCPLFAFTGLYCPTCGGTRCVYALTTGDLSLAFRSWPPFVLAFPAAAALYLAWLRSAWRGARFTLDPPRWLLWSLLLAALVFAMIRNIPAMSMLRPPTF